MCFACIIRCTPSHFVSWPCTNHKLWIHLSSASPFMSLAIERMAAKWKWSLGDTCNGLRPGDTNWLALSPAKLKPSVQRSAVIFVFFSSPYSMVFGLYLSQMRPLSQKEMRINSILETDTNHFGQVKSPIHSPMTQVQILCFGLQATGLGDSSPN